MFYCIHCQFYKKGKVCQHEGTLNSFSRGRMRWCTLKDLQIEDEPKKEEYYQEGI
jgi:hypothetical protein